MRLSRALVDIADVVAVARGAAKVSFAAVTERDLRDSRAVVERVLERGEPVYGLTTELGAGRDIVVPREVLDEFQRRTIRNSRGGIGESLSVEQARAVVFTRLVGFSRGGAGVTVALATQYRELLNRQITPIIPRTGSVGAGDLTQLAAVAAAASGIGTVLVDGVEVEAASALEPVVLHPHEALSALSSNAYSVGVGALVTTDLLALVPALDIAAALSLVAVGGNPSPFDARVQRAHASAWQAASAHRIARLLDATPSAPSTQDPISFRSVPQIHGAFALAVARLASAIELELNSRSENPLVDVESDSLISGGNFLVVDLAIAFDTTRIAIAHVASASERRLSHISAAGAELRRSGGASVPGLLWYSAASNVAELRQLASPVSLSSVPLSGGVEDHATNAPLAMQLLERSIELASNVVAVEAIAAVELIEASGAHTSGELTPVIEAIGEVIRSESSWSDKVLATVAVLTDAVLTGAKP
jgi:histidine ammonia-lyase